MSLESLEREILKGVTGAADEAALEAVRVSALGKKGTISERMKSLGAMAPDERKEAGAALNLLKDRIARRSLPASRDLQEAGARSAARHREGRCHASRSGPNARAPSIR